MLPLNRDKERNWQPYISIRSRSRNIEPVRSIGLLCCWPQWETNHNIATGCKHSPCRAAACRETSESFYYLYICLLFIYLCGQSADSAKSWPSGLTAAGELSSSSSARSRLAGTLLIAAVTSSHWIWLFLFFPLFLLPKWWDDLLSLCCMSTATRWMQRELLCHWQTAGGGE